MGEVSQLSWQGGDEHRVRKERLVVLAVESRDVPDPLLLCRAGLDGWHDELLFLSVHERDRGTTSRRRRDGSRWSGTPRAPVARAIAGRSDPRPGVRPGAADRRRRGGRSCPLCGCGAHPPGGRDRRPRRAPSRAFGANVFADHHITTCTAVRGERTHTVLPSRARRPRGSRSP